MEDILTNIAAGFILILGFVLFIIALVIPIQWLNAARCRETFASFEHRYSYWTGCQIKINDKWIPDEAFYIKEEKN